MITSDVVVVVRYPGYTRRAIIRRNKCKPSTRKRTKSGRPVAQMWSIVRYLDDEPQQTQDVCRAIAGGAREAEDVSI